MNLTLISMNLEKSKNEIALTKISTKKFAN